MTDEQTIKELIENTSKLSKAERLSVLNITEGLLLKKNDNLKENYNDMKNKKQLANI